MKQTITPHSVANTVRLSRTQHNRSVILTEGDTDARVLKRFVDLTSCSVTVAHGKQNAVAALALLKREGRDGILCVVDKDFGKGQASATNADIVYTDSHDLETMMFQTPTLEKVLDEFGSSEKIATFLASAGKDIRQLLIDAALPIGHLRALSEAHQWDLKFEGCDYGAFVDRERLTTNLSGLVQEIINKSQKHSMDQAMIGGMLEQEQKKEASSPEFVGEFRLRQGAKAVI
jgi:hypothetical protein